jgi:hypothetical protein
MREGQDRAVNGRGCAGCGALTHTAQATLVITPPPDFTLTASPTSVTLTLK